MSGQYTIAKKVIRKTLRLSSVKGKTAEDFRDSSGARRAKSLILRL